VPRLGRGRLSQGKRGLLSTLRTEIGMLPCHLSGVVLGLVASLLLHLSAVDAGQPVRESAAPSPKIVEGTDGVRDVFVLQGTVWQNLTAFKLPRLIYSYAASPDGRYVFVWHEAKPPRRTPQKKGRDI